MSRPQHERLTGRLDAQLEGVAIVDALRAARELVLVLERRLEIDTKPLDLFTLPLDLPKWDDLYADLVARAITETASVGKAATLIGRSRATLYNQLHKGILDAHVASDPDLASVLGRLLGPAP